MRILTIEQVEANRCNEQIKHLKARHLLASSTANLGELKGDTQTSNTARSGLSLSTLDVPLAELRLTGLIDTATQLAKVLLDSVRVKTEIVTQVRGIGSQLVRRVTTQGAGAAVLGGLRGDVEGESADGGVEEGQVVFREETALRSEAAAHGIDDGVGEKFDVGLFLFLASLGGPGCAGENLAEIVARRKLLATGASALVAAHGLERTGKLKQQLDKAEDLNLCGVAGLCNGDDTVGDISRTSDNAQTSLHLLRPFVDAGQLAQSRVTTGNQGLERVDVRGVNGGKIWLRQGLGCLHLGLDIAGLGQSGSNICGKRRDEGSAGFVESAGRGAGELGILGHGLNSLAGLLGTKSVGEVGALGAHGAL